MKPSRLDELKALFFQAFKFALVGLSNTVLSYCVYALLIWLGLHYIPAHIIAFSLSVLNAFYWNSRKVFKRADSNRSVFLKMVLAYSVSFAFTLCSMYVMVDIWHISEYIAPLINLVITVPSNFLANKFWVFK